MHKKHTSSNTFKKQYECNLPEHDSQLREKGCESAAPVLTGGKGSRQGQERGGKAGVHRTGSRGRSVGARLGVTEQGPGAGAWAQGWGSQNRVPGRAISMAPLVLEEIEQSVYTSIG